MSATDLRQGLAGGEADAATSTPATLPALQALTSDSRRRSGSSAELASSASRTTDDLTSSARPRSDSNAAGGRRSRTNSISGTRSRSGSNASLRHTEIGGASNTRGAGCPRCGKVLADPIMVELHLRSCTGEGGR